MDRSIIVGKTVIVVIAAALVSVPLTMVAWAVMFKLQIPFSIGLWVIHFLPPKEGFEGLSRIADAFIIDVFLYCGGICLLTYIAEKRRQSRPA